MYMSSQEKANQLVDSMYLIISNNGQFTGEHSIPFKFEEAKKCALITVSEIVEVLSKDINPLVNYWFEVKQEIEKL